MQFGHDKLEMLSLPHLQVKVRGEGQAMDTNVAISLLLEHSTERLGKPFQRESI